MVVGGYGFHPEGCRNVRARPSEEARRQHLQVQAVVEQAKRLLMARFGCGPDMAFELLRGRPRTPTSRFTWSLNG